MILTFQIDGALTLGENIADNGGLREAYYAYKLYEMQYGEEPKLPGLEQYSHEQLLFISFGNVRCNTFGVHFPWSFDMGANEALRGLGGSVYSKSIWRGPLGSTPQRLYQKKLIFFSTKFFSRR